MKHLLAILLLSLICCTSFAQQRTLKTWEDTIKINYGIATATPRSMKQSQAYYWLFLKDLLKAYVDSAVASGGGEGGAGMAYGNPVTGAGNYQILVTDMEGKLTGSDALTSSGGSLVQGDLITGNVLQIGQIDLYTEAGYMEANAYLGPSLRFVKYGVIQETLVVTDTGLTLIGDDGQGRVARRTEVVNNATVIQSTGDASFTVPAGKMLHSITIFSDANDTFDIGRFEGTDDILSGAEVLSDVPKTFIIDDGVLSLTDPVAVHITKTSSGGSGITFQIRIW